MRGIKHMLDNKQIEENKNYFIALIKSIKRDDSDIDSLVDYLENKSDFFTAPASTVYHNNFEGGLCEHSLNVYKCFMDFVKSNLKIVGADGRTSCQYMYQTDNWTWTIDEDSIKIVTLLHDISKANYYEKYFVNKKKYSQFGSKHDENGRFDWVSESAYKVSNESDRFIFSSHGCNSEFIVRSFIPLSVEESAAIINHHANMGEMNTAVNMSEIMNRFSLVTILHISDVLATFFFERK